MDSYNYIVTSEDSEVQYVMQVLWSIHSLVEQIIDNLSYDVHSEIYNVIEYEIHNHLVLGHKNFVVNLVFVFDWISHLSVMKHHHKHVNTSDQSFVIRFDLY